MQNLLQKTVKLKRMSLKRQKKASVEAEKLLKAIDENSPEIKKIN
jgi:hypothetical protein